MPRVAPIVPSESDLLCEGCGYTLKGLPLDGNCPECGKPIAQSVGEHRHPSEFEQSPNPKTFLRTTANVIFHPAQFYKSLETRSHKPTADRFAQVHRAIAATLFVMAALGHFLWALDTSSSAIDPAHELMLVIFAAGAMYLILLGLTRLATWLSAIEAKYWGMRLPYFVVMRGLTFHNANYLPVGLLAVGIVWGYRVLLNENILDRTRDTIYLYTLCIAVVISAGYLFRNYWIAMRSMMYANR
ncbi:MAG TPA: hypothetical protein VGF52_01845 [Tepidisphaeraceae bacterium]